MSRVRISNDSLNSYGTRILTAGMNVEQYCRNPVLLYMHERGNVIGYVKGLKVENGEVTGELVFDEATELSKRCKKQFEFGSLKMVSAGLDILELSDSKELLVEGQTRPTVTRSKLFEVSVVDIGANDDALVLVHNGKQITCGKDGECDLPLLNNKKQSRQMDQKILAIALGLPETADEAAISAKIQEMKAAQDEAAKLKTEIDGLKLSAITTAVQKAITDKRITEDKKEKFIELGKKIGVEELSAVFESMAPQIKLSQVIGQHGGKPTGQVSYNKLSEVPADKILELRAKDPEEYKRLYKAEYGIECKIEEGE